MININIPIFRAKKIDSDEYVIGNLIEDEGVFYIIKNPVVTHFNGLQQLTGECEYLDRVDPTILAINLPDMLDSQGNKIFASLREDGKGGDKFLFDNEIFIIWFDNQSLKINATNKDNFECSCHDSLQEWYDFNIKCYDLKVIGIQK